MKKIIVSLFLVACSLNIAGSNRGLIENRQNYVPSLLTHAASYFIQNSSVNIPEGVPRDVRRPIDMLRKRGIPVPQLFIEKCGPKAALYFHTCYFEDTNKNSEFIFNIFRKHNDYNKKSEKLYYAIKKNVNALSNYFDKEYCSISSVHTINDKKCVDGVGAFAMFDTLGILAVAAKNNDTEFLKLFLKNENIQNIVAFLNPPCNNHVNVFALNTLITAAEHNASEAYIMLREALVGKKSIQNIDHRYLYWINCATRDKKMKTMINDLEPKSTVTLVTQEVNNQLTQLLRTFRFSFWFFRHLPFFKNFFKKNT